ncbi:hypothetical protein SAMN05443661_11528 [Natronobacterium gregoryi]|uniref:Uncharacterized protein n=2 Tax=Natronobacterium gregoryi TaxID=44930 RepID=L0AFV6_NATGS|nr:hypothetical protein Natgr_0693 [Natronobacterium gregoryi SP2]SFJ13283.1 hypothetical protein SAMN05443661_11528 [Natronobacterium gregoryi]
MRPFPEPITERLLYRVELQYFKINVNLCYISAGSYEADGTDFDRPVSQRQSEPLPDRSVPRRIWSHSRAFVSRGLQSTLPIDTH